MNKELQARIEAALSSLENLEHRVSGVIEGNRMQLSHLAEHLKIRELRAELRSIATALRRHDATPE
jgi:hypothetical protein